MRRWDAVGLRSETVRRANLSRIVRDLHVHGPQTRSELVASTGLTRSAIRGLIGELSGTGLVTEEPAERQGLPGRPSPIVRPNPVRTIVLALEIAVDSMAAARVGLGGEVLELVRVDRPRQHKAPDDIIDDLLHLPPVRAHEAGKDLLGVGVAMVGVVRRSDGCVSVAPNLGWHDVPLGERLRARLPTGLDVAVANEGDLGALAEVRRGAARGAENVLFISGEVGVGGGVIVAGQPLTGRSGYAGEVGHLPVNPDGQPCGCGSIGCWETEVGERALLTRAGHSPDGGRREAEAVLREAADGQPPAVAAVESVGRWVGIGLAGLVNVFNPELIVLGGLLGRIQPLAAASIERELDRRALAAPRRVVRVVPSSLGTDAPLLGAAELAFEPLLSDPAQWLRPSEPLAAAG